MISYRFVSWADLSLDDAHELFALRQAVFVVEQDCAYQDIDGIDPQCEHLLAHEDGVLVACLRLVPIGVRHDDAWAIGRVVTSTSVRGRGVARTAMTRAIERIAELASGVNVRVGAQCYLEQFYASLGFVRCSDDYDEDGIPHLDMLRAPTG